MLAKIKTWAMWIGGILLVIGIILGVRFFSEESQNNFNRSWQTAVGFKHGRVDILAGQPKPVMTWLNVEKLTTPKDENGKDKNYRFGYGYFDTNMNGLLDASEKEEGKIYFELGQYTMYVFRDAGKGEKAEPELSKL